MRKLLYKEMEVSIEAKLNVVHTAYVVLRCTSNDEVEFGHVHATFWCLINRYFCEQKVNSESCLHFIYPRLDHLTCLYVSCFIA